MMMKCESMEYVEHRYIYIYINIFITIVHSLYTVQVLHVQHFFILLQIQFNSRYTQPLRIRKIYIIYIKKDKI